MAMTAMRAEQLRILLLELGRPGFPIELARVLLAMVGADLVCIDAFADETAWRATIVEMARDPAMDGIDHLRFGPWPTHRRDSGGDPALFEHSRLVEAAEPGGPPRRISTLGAVLGDAGGAAIVLSLVRILADSERAVADRAALTAVLPLLRALWQAHQRCLATEAERNALFESLGQRGLGAITLDRRGAPMSINRRATELMRDGAVLGFSPNRLVVGDRSEAACLRESLAALLDEMQEGRRGAPRAVTLGDRAGSEALRVQLCPVAPGLRHEGARTPAVVAVIEDLQRDLRPEVCANAARFGLTAVETALVCRLAQGQALDRAAAEQRISIHTARKYLQQIFGKTQTCRQADLIRLMISGAAPPAPAALLPGDAPRRRAVR